MPVPSLNPVSATLRGAAGDNVRLAPEHFRKAVACFATGIAIVTCRDETSGQVHGMTVNSFTSISLDPASILISIKAGRMLRLISRENHFGISVLSAAQQPHSAHFSGRPGEFAPEFAVRHGAPTLKECLAWFECQVTSRIQVHDHTLFVADVIHCNSGDGLPLLFYSICYRALEQEAHQADTETNKNEVRG